MSKQKFAVLVESSYTVPGDERSRTNPGHGYPEHTEHYTEFINLETADELQKWVEREEKSLHGKRKYKVIQYTELEVKTKVEIQIS